MEPRRMPRQEACKQAKRKSTPTGQGFSSAGWAMGGQKVELHCQPGDSPNLESTRQLHKSPMAVLTLIRLPEATLLDIMVFVERTAAAAEHPGCDGEATNARGGMSSVSGKSTATSAQPTPKCRECLLHATNRSVIMRLSESKAPCWIRCKIEHEQQQ